MQATTDAAKESLAGYCLYDTHRVGCRRSTTGCPIRLDAPVGL